MRCGRLHKKVAMNNISDTDAAYIAGFLDGEGYITLVRNHWGNAAKTSSYILKVSITNTDKSILEWIKNIVGIGNVYVKRPAKEHYLPCWEWCLGSANLAKPFLERLYPYLRIKRNQADIGIRYGETSCLKSNKKLPQNVIDLREVLREKMLSENRKRRTNSSAIIEKHY